MKCPYCNKEMEKGYIQSKHGLGWNRKKRVLAVILGAVMTMSLAACGGGTKETQGQASSETAAASGESAGTEAGGNPK